MDHSSILRSHRPRLICHPSASSTLIPSSPQSSTSWNTRDYSYNPKQHSFTSTPHCTIGSTHFNSSLYYRNKRIPTTPRTNTLRPRLVPLVDPSIMTLGVSLEAPNPMSSSHSQPPKTYSKLPSRSF